MPFYDYKCQKCNRTFEVQKRMNDSSVPDCPKCKTPAQRIFNVPLTLRASKDILARADTGQGSSCSSLSSSACSSCRGG